jgi:hypothetical protein
MSIHVDWQSLFVVAIVSIVAAVLFTLLLSGGIRFVSLATVRSNQRESSIVPRVAGFGLLGLAGVLVLFGIYLIVPFFH